MDIYDLMKQVNEWVKEIGILWQSASLIFSYDRSWVEVGSSNLFSTIFAMFKLFFEVEWSSSFSRRIFREVKMLLLLRLEKFAILRWREFFWKIKKWSTIFQNSPPTGLPVGFFVSGVNLSSTRVLPESGESPLFTYEGVFQTLSR